MKWLKNLIRKIVVEEIQQQENDLWITIHCLEGSWYTNTPDNITSNCLFEIQHNRKINSYRIKCSGKDPEQHSVYIKAALTVAKLNADNNDIKEALETVKYILSK